jgi:hypothetical protein
MPKAETAAARVGVRLLQLAAGMPAELRALAPSALSGSDGLLVMPGAMFCSNRATIIGPHRWLACPPFIRTKLPEWRKT